MAANSSTKPGMINKVRTTDLSPKMSQRGNRPARPIDCTAAYNRASTADGFSRSMVGATGG
jgi:hypothetical protein